MKKRNVTTIAGGGGSLLSRPTESGAIHLNPSEWTTNKTKALAGDWTTKKVNQSSLRATNGSVAIQSTNATNSNGLPRVLRTLAMTNNKRAIARLNCHSGLDPESYQRYERECNSGQMLKRVQDDSKRNNPITNLTSYRLNDLATCAGQGASLIDLRACGHVAFTMAEILLSLTIIGVVAAITLPSLTGNINERTWNTQRKALYARFSQAIALLPALNGYGTLTAGDASTSAVDTATETFITDGLSKVLKINNICDSEHLEDCGIPSKITALDGSLISSIPKNLTSFNDMFNGSFDASGTGYDDGEILYTYSQLDTKAAAFETQNGESILVYYNPNCVGDMGETEGYYSQPKMCANFVYDLNGNKGPNTVGKDIGFMSALYPTDSVVVAPVVLNSDAISGNVTHKDSMSQCIKQDTESRVPNKEELASMFYNRLLIGNYNFAYWSSATLIKNSIIHAWGLYMTTGRLYPSVGSGPLRCVKR